MKWGGGMEENKFQLWVVSNFYAMYLFHRMALPHLVMSTDNLDIYFGLGLK